MFRYLPLLLLLGCHSISQYPTQPPTTSKAIFDQVNLKVNWVTNIDVIAKACESRNTTYGCAVKNGSSCVIYVVEPIDFNDVPKLAMLGHEVWHCLGARH